MKKVAFILYVGCVLAFSAFARAEMVMPFSSKANFRTPIQIESITIDKNTLDIKVFGYLPNPCTDLPTATLSQDLENPSILVLRMSSPLHNGICVSKTENYTEIVSLPALAQKSRLSLDVNTVYLLKADGNDFAIEVRGIELMRVPGFVSF